MNFPGIFIHIFVVRANGSSNDNPRVPGGAPPSVVSDCVVVDGDVVPLVHSDAGVRAATYIIVVDIQMRSYERIRIKPRKSFFY